MAFTQSNAIEVKQVKGKGQGVFARRLIRQGEVIERVPMLVLTAEEFEDRLAGTSLANYCFARQDQQHGGARWSVPAARLETPPSSRPWECAWFELNRWE